MRRGEGVQPWLALRSLFALSASAVTTAVDDSEGGDGLGADSSELTAGLCSAAHAAPFWTHTAAAARRGSVGPMDAAWQQEESVPGAMAHTRKHSDQAEFALLARADTEPRRAHHSPPERRQSTHIARPQVRSSTIARGGPQRVNGRLTAHPRSRDSRSRCASRFQVSGDAVAPSSCAKGDARYCDSLSENACTRLGTGTGVGCPLRRL